MGSAGSTVILCELSKINESTPLLPCFGFFGLINRTELLVNKGS